MATQNGLGLEDPKGPARRQEVMNKGPNRTPRESYRNQIKASGLAPGRRVCPEPSQAARGVPGNNVYTYKHKRIHVHTHTRVISMQAPLAGSLRRRARGSCWMKSSNHLLVYGVKEKEGIIRTPREIHNTSAHMLNPPLPRALLPVRGLCGGMWVVDPYLASTRCW